MAKSFKDIEDINKHMVYGALLGIVKSPKHFRRSRVGKEYSHLTEEGRDILLRQIEEILKTIDQLDRESTDERAKEITMESLKG